MTDEILKWHKSDLLNRMYINVGDGKKAAMPRYFKDKIYNQSQRDRIAFFAGIKAQLLKEKTEDQWKKDYGDNWVKIKTEADKAQFQKMYKDAQKGRNKV